MSDQNEQRTIIVENTSGERFDCVLPVNTTLETIAADFFEKNEWPTTDNRGKGQRAVVELVDPQNPDRTKRLKNDLTIDEAGLYDNAVLRIFPESIAGVRDDRKRLSALIADHKDMLELASWNKKILFKTNTSHAPTLYMITFKYDSYKCLSSDGKEPLLLNKHEVEILLHENYPQEAPYVKWITPIFHPNISAETGDVCLGVLKKRYLPGLGLARIVVMLSEMIQFRNFDKTDSLNTNAAEWINDPENWKYIEDIGGYPYQGSINEIFNEMEKIWGGNRSKIVFKPNKR
ncbi:MAG: hypothetical protein OMM_03147 [Candidatus Magnetoglobus multicellularis str. Araruama]|uniref:UBC core domain-containing protein n=1 Tax=Candidatus Magnetoglobus multicellularis str. Araruama TaxID=890399 RepID=A0A1V1P6R5_9BACT|nr:MAG: hypothetical protein OMM_03147 [Candidatus Magnetoglobus multicellularis str. Araruama]